jgi:DNA repair exonuclease SbcCD ATPase subunit
MELNYSKIFNKETLGGVESFCKLNNIDDIDSFIKNIFQEGFNIKKYGLLGKTLNEGEKDLKTGGIEEKRVEIEVIREILVEVPVEVIKEVEKIVTKIEYISDKNGETELLSKIEHLNEEVSIKTTEIDKIRQEFSTKTTEMENIFQDKMSKKEQELDELRQELDKQLDRPPVEKIVEVVVEKESTNNSLKPKLDALQTTLAKVRQETLEKDKKIRELEQTIQEIQKFQDNKQAVYFKGSNLDDKLYK